jgi:hypothetical protein
MPWSSGRGEAVGDHWQYGESCSRIQACTRRGRAVVLTVIWPGCRLSFTAPIHSKTPMLTPGVGGVTPATSSWDLDGV